MIELFEIADALERKAPKGAFALESMKDDAFEEVAEGEVVVLGKGLQNLEDAFFHPDAGLNSFDLQLGFRDGRTVHGYLCTKVHG